MASSKKLSVKPSKKGCPEGKILSSKGKCIKLGGRAHKRDFPEDYERYIKRSKPNKTSRAPKAKPKTLPVTKPLKATKKSSVKPSKKGCPEGKILSSKGKCIKLGGRAHKRDFPEDYERYIKSLKKPLKTKSSKPSKTSRAPKKISASKSSLITSKIVKTLKEDCRKNKDLCEEKQICDEETGKCVSKTTKKGKELLEAYKNPFKIIKDGKNCIDRSKILLKDYQIKAVKHLNDNDSIGLLFATGAGKTITAVTIARCFLDKNPKSNVIVITPPSLKDNFKKEIRKYGMNVYSNFKFYTPDGILIAKKKGVKINCKNSLLIIDEVHNLRNFDSEKYKAVLDCAENSKKRVLMTATPFVNNLNDFVPFINLLYGKIVVYGKKFFGGGNKFNAERLTYDNLGDFLQGKILYYSEKSLKDYPEVEIVYIKNKMKEDYERKYINIIATGELNEDLDEKQTDTIGAVLRKVVFGDPKRFYNGHRRAVNKLNQGEGYFSSKINSVIKKIKIRGKSIIFSNWLEFGVKTISNRLEQEKIKYGVITGETNVSARQMIVDRFNKDEYQCLVLSPAGSEGLDLKGVRNVFILDPPWNNAKLEQMIGRAVRFRSHSHLPKSERKVKIYLLVLLASTDEMNDEFPFFNAKENYISGDAILYSVIQDKKEQEEVINEILKKASI